MKKIKTQKQLDDRTTEIQGMSNKQLVWALQAESGWESQARREMRIELANNTYEDMEIIKNEILRRMVLSRNTPIIGVSSNQPDRKKTLDYKL